MVYPDTAPDFDDFRFEDCDWSEYYQNAVEAIPKDIPKLRGRAVMCSCFLHADHTEY